MRTDPGKGKIEGTQVVAGIAVHTVAAAVCEPWFVDCVELEEITGRLCRTFAGGQSRTLISDHEGTKSEDVVDFVGK